MDDEKYEQLSGAIADLAGAVGEGFASVDRHLADLKGDLGLLKGEQFTTNRRLNAIEARLGQLELKRRR